MEQTETLAIRDSFSVPDGKLVALYYISELKTGPERYIGATIFDPNSIREQ